MILEWYEWFWNKLEVITFSSLPLPHTPGFPTGVENMGGRSSRFDGGGLKSIHGGSMSGALNADEKNPVKEFIW